MSHPSGPATWFISDLHLGDDSIIPVCRAQFTSVQEMDDLLIRQWVSRVRPDDVVFVLGDVTGSNAAAREQGLSQIPRLTGHKILVPGNHESLYGVDPDTPAWATAAAPYLQAGFEQVLPGPAVTRLETRTGSAELVLSHFPCHRSYFETTDRYRAYRPGDIGTLVVHGHVHDAWKVLATAAGTTQINVSPEVSGYAPTRGEDVLALAAAPAPRAHTPQAPTAAAAVSGGGRT